MFITGRNLTRTPGVVRSFGMRTEGIFRLWGVGDLNVWSFRLERNDQAGSPLPLLPVELRGPVFEGILHDGDEVEVVGKVRNGTMIASKVINHAASPPSIVRATGKSIRSLLIAIGLIGALIFGLLSSGIVTTFAARIAESSAVPLSNCLILTSNATIHEHVLGAGVPIAKILGNTQRLVAFRRADIMLGLYTQFQVKVNERMGWIQGFIEETSGDCSGSESNTSAVDDTKQKTFPEVPPEILGVAESVRDDCMVATRHWAFDTDIYKLPDMRSQYAGVLPPGSYKPLLFYSGMTGEWFYVQGVDIRGWVQQIFVQLNCGQSSEPTLIPTPTQNASIFR